MFTGRRCPEGTIADAASRRQFMANEKILVFEAPWSPRIDETQATKDIYMSAETLLRVGPEPVRVIHRPLISSSYTRDIQKFAALECNQRGPNFVIFSAHGSLKLRRNKSKVKYRRELRAFDGKINLSAEIRDVSESLTRTIIILDSCDIGGKIKSFYHASGAAGVIGFTEEVDWVDSTTFILAVLLKYYGGGVMTQKRIRKTTTKTVSSQQKVLEGMTKGAWKSLAESLGVESYFGP